MNILADNVKHLPNKALKFISKAQRQEITEHLIYLKLASVCKDKKNKAVLQHISNEEKKQYFFWKKYTGKDIGHSTLLLWWYYLLARFLGLTFALKLMERGESRIQKNYAGWLKYLPESMGVMKDEQKHEEKLINLLGEKKLQYIGSIVLGLNDALVELTGALAGLTLALRDNKIIAISGLIIGVAAAFSMAASAYLSRKAEKSLAKNSLRASIYTGIAYIITVILLVLPYLIFSNVFFSLACTIVMGITIIFGFTFYTSVAQDLPFQRRFWEMALISLGVSAFSFGVGYLARLVLEVNILLVK
ncbi:VIT1/CCC1 transporter family protein [Candidatus Woesearchaeota archaeon]|nr:VIT1/CCC1 transporter family protein [Candidatus Woesearchaeota archaeon]